MFSNGSNNYSCALPFGFFAQHASHKCAVIIIRVADRFIQKDEIERLAEARMKATRCCCPKDNFPAFVYFLSDTECFKKCKDFFFFL